MVIKEGSLVVTGFRIVRVEFHTSGSTNIGAFEGSISVAEWRRWRWTERRVSL